MQPQSQRRVTSDLNEADQIHIHITQPVYSICFNSDQCLCNFVFLKPKQNFPCGNLCSLPLILLVYTSKKSYRLFSSLTNYLVFANDQHIELTPSSLLIGSVTWELEVGAIPPYCLPLQFCGLIPQTGAQHGRISS